MRELGGMKGVRLKDITYGNVCEKSLRNTETTTQSGTDTHQRVKRSKRKLRKNNRTIGTEVCQEAG